MANKTAALVEIEAKSVDDDGTFEGYASVFNVRDQGGDIILPGAFAKSLAARPAARVKMLSQHRQDEPIGVWLELREDDRGLLAKGRLILETTKGREIHALMKAGAIDGLSIGYRVVRDRLDRAKKARVIEEVELLEISTVTFPMNDSATVSRVKTSNTSFSDLVAAINGARDTLKGTK